MKKIGIIGGGRLASVIAECAKDMGIETHAFSLDNGFTDKRSFDYTYSINILDREEVLNLCKKIEINGVIATTEITISVASFVADKLNLNGIPIGIAEIITDKYRNRDMTKNIKNLYHPEYIIASSIEEVIESELNYPIILKPTSKGGKRGIIVAHELKDLAQAFNYAVKGASGKLPLIVEEYIEGGMEISLESLSYSGKHYLIQTTEKITSGAPHCVELSHHQPANIKPQILATVEQVLDKALDQIGIQYGPCHTEFKIKNDKIYLIEFNARPGGDHIAHPLTELSTGYPYIKGVIEISLNIFNDIDKESFANKYSGVLFVTEQTKELLPIFDKCESYEWCYTKNKVTEELKSIIHNDGFNINYFIYSDIIKPKFQQIEGE